MDKRSRRQEIGKMVGEDFAEGRRTRRDHPCVAVEAMHGNDNYYTLSISYRNTRGRYQTQFDNAFLIRLCNGSRAPEWTGIDWCLKSYDLFANLFGQHACA